LKDTQTSLSEATDAKRNLEQELRDTKSTLERKTYEFDMAKTETS